MLLKGRFECVISCYHRLFCYLFVIVEGVYVNALDAKGIQIHQMFIMCLYVHGDAAEPLSVQLEKDGTWARCSVSLTTVFSIPIVAVTIFRSK